MCLQFTQLIRIMGITYISEKFSIIYNYIFHHVQFSFSLSLFFCECFFHFCLFLCRNQGKFIIINNIVALLFLLFCLCNKDKVFLPANERFSLWLLLVLLLPLPFILYVIRGKGFGGSDIFVFVELIISGEI